jgi:S-adenosylmethionine synthetase
LANRDFVFTSESVSEGHPDKTGFPDAIRWFLAVELQARCGVETPVTPITWCWPERYAARRRHNDRLIEVARNAIRAIGYEQDKLAIGGDQMPDPRQSSISPRSMPWATRTAGARA